MQQIVLVKVLQQQENQDTYIINIVNLNSSLIINIKLGQFISKLDQLLLMLEIIANQFLFLLQISKILVCIILKLQFFIQFIQNGISLVCQYFYYHYYSFLKSHIINHYLVNFYQYLITCLKRRSLAVNHFKIFIIDYLKYFHFIKASLFFQKVNSNLNLFLEALIFFQNFFFLFLALTYPTYLQLQFDQQPYEVHHCLCHCTLSFDFLLALESFLIINFNLNIFLIQFAIHSINLLSKNNLNQYLEDFILCFYNLQFLYFSSIFMFH
ncbi:transmembrane protein, putative (macronuclear) [Tetrahymena thermophila SB210]|uniref:Transmembrane protein, putative n=1 Tax=Tetrahymena thermophila (strain SB210) TaxID=312017 RepID=W7XEA9_TETTS|nr:transmembrane protein, putative [Tetrahymena thermophila SB210]EWS72276.1 transmembrane protein, putative [Tetrahymena thermophila SB210]|eukprot:XP_012655216.1 transmembrane protein, putative [Tetrahymena thermophila SB210]